MPLNSFQCRQCGKRNNYVIELDDNGEQVVVCSACDTPTTITYDELSSRIRETIAELNRDAKIFEDESQAEASALEPVDTVDETLSQVEQRFEEARNIMSDFDDIVGLKTNILSIADEYISDDTMSSVNNILSKIIDEDGRLQSGWKKDGLTATLDELCSRSEQQDNSDTTTYRIMSYIKQAIQQGSSLEDIASIDAMKAAGLNRKEQFIVKQATKNKHIANLYLNDIMKEY